MTYDPSEPRDKDGKWVGGGARGHNAGQVNRPLVDKILTQHQQAVAGAVIKGTAEGLIVGAAIGAVTGGFGAIAAPLTIARSVARGAASGFSKEAAAHAALGGAIGGLAEHHQRIQAKIEQQSK